MIIECINCNKKFNVNSELIPPSGRTIQCGACNHVWFFKREYVEPKKAEIPNKDISSLASLEKKRITKSTTKNTSAKINKKGSEIVKYQPSKKFSFSKLLSYIVVSILSFIALIILLDTFKTSLYDFFPNLEFFLFSFYEILIDIKLFINDLI